MINSGIYCIVNKLNGKFYIGSSNDIEGRFNQHRSCKKDYYLYNAIRKHGAENFEMTTLQAVENDTDALLAVEQKWLDAIFMLCPDMIYNISRSATAPMDGRKHTAEARQKMAEAKRGKPKSEAHKQKIAEAKRGAKNPYYDSTAYSFINTRTGESFSGTQHDFYTKYSLHKGNVCQMVQDNPKVQSVKGWQLA